MAEKEYKGPILAEDISPVIRPIAEKWAAALGASVEAMHNPDISREDKAELQLLVMQTAAAFCTGFEPTLVERQNISLHFLQQLHLMCEQYFQDKVAAGVVK